MAQPHAPITVPQLPVPVPIGAPMPDPDALTLTQHEKDMVIGMRLFGAFLSFFGSVFIMFSIIFFGRFKQMSTRLIFWLTLCNFGEAFGNIWSLWVYGQEEAREGACVFQGFILQSTQIAMFCWITIIAINLYLVVVLTHDTRKYEYFYHAAVIVISVLFSCIPFASQSYGAAGVWCWIVRPAQGLRWGLFFIPLILMIVGVLILYGFIIRHVRAIGEDAGHGEVHTKKLLSKLWVYPIAFAVCYFLPIINRIYDVTAWSDSFVLYFFAAFSSSVLGFVNAVIYGFDADMRKLWRKYLASKGCCLSWTNVDGDDQVESESDKEFGPASTPLIV